MRTRAKARDYVWSQLVPYVVAGFSPRYSHYHFSILNFIGQWPLVIS